MSSIVPTTLRTSAQALNDPIARTPRSDEDTRLREVAAQLEGVFLEQLMKALRDTVPEGGLTDGGMGEEIFSGLLDEHLSNLAAGEIDRGLGAALYRQLRGVGGTIG